MPTPERRKTPTVDRTLIEARRDAILASRDEARMQLTGFENQLYILDSILNPPQEAQEPAQDAETPGEGVDMPQGTV